MVDFFSATQCSINIGLMSDGDDPVFAYHATRRILQGGWATALAEIVEQDDEDIYERRG